MNCICTSAWQNPQNEKGALETFFVLLPSQEFFSHTGTFCCLSGLNLAYISRGYSVLLKDTVPPVNLKFFSDQFIFKNGGFHTIFQRKLMLMISRSVPPSARKRKAISGFIQARLSLSKIQGLLKTILQFSRNKSL